MVFDILWFDVAWILYYAKGSAVLHPVLPSNYVSIFRVFVSLIVSLFLFCSPIFPFFHVISCYIMSVLPLITYCNIVWHNAVSSTVQSNLIYNTDMTMI